MEEAKGKRKRKKMNNGNFVTPLSSDGKGKGS
jgi:hypothetical protein